MSRALGLTDEGGRVCRRALRRRRLRVRARVVGELGRVGDSVSGTIVADETLHVFLYFKLLQRKSKHLARLYKP